MSISFPEFPKAIGRASAPCPLPARPVATITGPDVPKWRLAGDGYLPAKISGRGDTRFNGIDAQGFINKLATKHGLASPKKHILTVPFFPGAEA